MRTAAWEADSRSTLSPECGMWVARRDCRPPREHLGVHQHRLTVLLYTWFLLGRPIGAMSASRASRSQTRFALPRVRPTSSVPRSSGPRGTITSVVGREDNGRSLSSGYCRHPPTWSSVEMQDPRFAEISSQAPGSYFPIARKEKLR